MEELAKRCLELVGGEGNVKAVSHCATRLRLTLKDRDKVDEVGLNATPGVLKVMNVGTQTQIVVGADAPELYGVVSKMVDAWREAGGATEPTATSVAGGGTSGLGADAAGHASAAAEPTAVSGASSGTSAAAKGKASSLVGKFFDACSSMFTPLVPAFTAAGLIKAILAILVAFGLPKASQEYVIINFVSDTIFNMLPVILAVPCAAYFGCNRYIAAAICAMFVAPAYTDMVAAGEPVSFFGVSVTLYNYASTVFPTILTVWFMSYVERFSNKVSPKVVKAILAPMLTFLVTFPVGLLILGPIGATLGEWFMQFFKVLDVYVPFLVPTVMGACTPFLVFVGMHRAVGTLETMQIAQQGASAISGSGQLPSNLAQGAATLVLSLKSRDEKYKPLAFTAGITAVCGITEPALYGFSSKNRKSLIATICGGAVGGFYAGCTHVVRFAKGAPGLPTLPVFIDPADPMNLVNACVAAAIGFVVSFVVAWVIIKPGEPR